MTSLDRQHSADATERPRPRWYPLAYWLHRRLPTWRPLAARLYADRIHLLRPQWRTLAEQLTAPPPDRPYRVYRIYDSHASP